MILNLILIYLAIGLAVAITAQSATIFIPGREPSLRSFAYGVFMWPVAAIALVAVAVLALGLVIVGAGRRLAQLCRRS